MSALMALWVCIGVPLAVFVPTMPVDGLTLLKRAAIAGAMIMWPLALALATLTAIAAACYYAPIAAMHLWRTVRKAALAEAEELQKP